MPAVMLYFRAETKRLLKLAYRMTRLLYRKLKNDFGVDVLNCKVPILNKTLKALVYQKIKQLRPIASSVNSTLLPEPPKIPKQKDGDYICFSRIIGNEIVTDSSALGRLKRILNEEQDLVGVHRFFIINRVVSKFRAQELKDILTEYELPFSEIPFLPGGYLQEAQQDQTNDNEVETPITENPRVKIANTVRRNKYLMNFCGAINFALNYSRKNGYQWVFPWSWYRSLGVEDLEQIKWVLNVNRNSSSFLFVEVNDRVEVLNKPILDKDISGLVDFDIILSTLNDTEFNLNSVFGKYMNLPDVYQSKICPLIIAQLFETSWDDQSALEGCVGQVPQEKASSIGDNNKPEVGDKVNSQVKKLLEFSDDVYRYSKKVVCVDSKIDYLYYRQVESDKLVAAKQSISVNTVFDKVYLVSLKRDLEKRFKAAGILRAQGIDFEWFPAVNGYEGEPLTVYQEYLKRPLGKMKGFDEYSDYEKNRGSKLIESPGAVGYIYTYIAILNNAKEQGYQNILILEDDILLCDRFSQRFELFMRSVKADWKLLHLGCSQYEWDKVNLAKSLSNGHYYPRVHATKGSFSIGLNSSIFDELIENILHFDAPFDNFPIGALYEKYYGSCFVAYPYLVMPDVTTSSIRGERSQYSHANSVGWWVSDYAYPTQKPCVGVLLKSKSNLGSLRRESIRELPYTLNLYFLSENGISPLHNGSLLPDTYWKEEVSSEVYSMSKLSLDVFLEVDPRLQLSEHLITRAVEDVLVEGSAPKGVSLIGQTDVFRVKGRVSVILPTYKRPAYLRQAMVSVLEQDYDDVELIVVDDNGVDSPFSAETRAIVQNCAAQFPDRTVKIVQHIRNANGAAARNSGFLNSSGEYICFLDDDDIYLQGRISKCVSELNNAGGNIGAVYCGFLGWNSPRLDENRFKTGDLTKEIFMLEYKKHYLHTNTATYRAAAILAINGFDESYRRHQDLEFNLRFFEHYEIGAVKDVLVELAPAKSSIDNKLYGRDMLNLKRKFLSDFEYLISKYTDEEQEMIYNAHFKEVVRYVDNNIDKASLFNYIRGNTGAILSQGVMTVE